MPKSAPVPDEVVRTDEMDVVEPTAVERVESVLPSAVEARDVTAVAAAESVKALVQGRILMAIRRPRDIDEVRRRLLNDCRRPRFAESARYAKPIGGGTVRGWSIRFAEAVVRHLGNIDCRASVIAEDDARLVLRFDAVDLESNASFGGEVAITRTVERRRLRPGEVALSVRTNSRGEATYTVRANDDDMAVKLASAVSKGIRTYALRLCPADLLEEAAEVIASAGTGEDPSLARKRIVDAFASYGVGPEDVKRLAGVKDLTLLTPAQLQLLRETYTAVREGDLSVDEILSPQPTGADDHKTANERLREKLRTKAAPAAERTPGEEG